MRSPDSANMAAPTPAADPQSGPAPGARAPTRPDRPAAAAVAPMPALAKAASDGADPLARLIDRLLPRQDAAERARITALLSTRLADRVVSCWQRLGASIPSSFAPELRQMLEAEAIAAGAGVVSPEIAILLDPGAAVAMLMGDPAADMPGALLADPAPAVREAALDAMVSDAALMRFDRVCGRILEARVSASLDRLNLSDRQRLEWHDRLVTREAPAAAPLHEEANEAALLAALRRGDQRAAIMLLAAAALVPADSIETAVALRSRRGLVSLAWRAGFSMRVAVLLQSHLAGIQPDAVLVSLPDGSCPLSRNEMVWQISFLSRRLA